MTFSWQLAIGQLLSIIIIIGVIGVAVSSFIFLRDIRRSLRGIEEKLDNMSKGK